jgi:hypothetical protein
LRSINSQPGQKSSLSIAAGAPKGGNSVLVEKQADAHPWATQMLMPSVAVEVGKTYVVSVWMKAMNPGPVSLGF